MALMGVGRMSDEIEKQAEENYTKVYLNGDMSLDTEEKYFAYTKGYCKGHTDGLAEGRKETEQLKASIITLQHDLKNITKRCEDYERALCEGCMCQPLGPDNEHCSKCYAGSERKEI